MHQPAIAPSPVPAPRRDAERRRSRGRCAGHAGRAAETMAAGRYAAQGWHEVARNWRADRLHGGGELDLVMSRDGVLVFIEVKARRSLDEAMESLRPAQMRRLAAAAERFVELLGDGPRDMRFDLVACDRWGRVEITENLWFD